MRWLCGLVLTAGCSFISSRRIDPVTAPKRVECNAVAPIFDSVTVPVLAVVDLANLGLHDEHEEDIQKAQTQVLVSVPFLLVYTASAIYGWTRYGSCARFRDLSPHERADQLMQQ